MKRDAFRRVIAVGLSAAMAATMTLGVSAATIQYDVPTSPMTVDENLITIAAHAQADATPEILGITNTTDRSREVPNDYSLSHAQNSVLIGTFGTDINSAPNPYLYNWAYNSYATENGLALTDKHTLGGISGNPNSVDTQVGEEWGGTSRSLYYRPDILLGTSGGDYNTLIAALPENTDSDTSNDYNPYIVNYPMSVCSDFLTSAYELANICKEIMEKDSSRYTRYGDPVEIADNLTKYDLGIQSYILAQLEKDGKEKKTVAIFDPSKSTDGVFYGVDDTISTQGTTTHARVGEFLAQTTINVADKIGRDAVDGTGDLAGKNYFPLSAKEIVENADIIVTGGIQVGGGMSEDSVREMLINYLDPADTELISKAKTMPVMASSFDTVGTIGANSIENLLGMAYWPAYCYSEYVNPVYAAAYWYNHFYHVTDNAKLATIIDSTMSTASRPDGVTTDISGYSDTEFQKKIDEGMAYYNANKEKINNETLDAFASKLSDNASDSDDDNDDNTVSVTDFTDVAAGSWYYDAVDYAVTNKLFAGTSDTTFSPENSMTRGMFATVLYRSQQNPVITGTNPFRDVASSDYFYNGVTWSYLHQIVNGISSTEFGPNNDVTREQIAVMFYNAAQSIGKDTSASGSLAAFPDAASVDSWATDAMQWAVGSGLITGSDGQLVPLGNATRAQVAIMFQRFLALN